MFGGISVGGDPVQAFSYIKAISALYITSISVWGYYCWEEMQCRLPAVVRQTSALYITSVSGISVGG